MVEPQGPNQATTGFLQISIQLIKRSRSQDAQVVIEDDLLSSHSTFHENQFDYQNGGKTIVRNCLGNMQMGYKCTNM